MYTRVQAPLTATRFLGSRYTFRPLPTPLPGTRRNRNADRHLRDPGSLLGHTDLDLRGSRPRLILNTPLLSHASLIASCQFHSHLTCSLIEKQPRTCFKYYTSINISRFYLFLQPVIVSDVFYDWIYYNFCILYINIHLLYYISYM